MPNPYRVCFVCTGNICRSPMAEAVFRRYLDKAGLAGLVEVDSAGLGGWHVGESADRRALAVLRARGYTCDHRARRFDVAWFRDRHLLVALDDGHLRALRRLAPDQTAAGRIRLLRSFDPAAAGPTGSGHGGLDLDVPDPYYGYSADFEHCLTLIEAACLGLLDYVAAAVTDR
jgi:protein-tyrosine phosphatase